MNDAELDGLLDAWEAPAPPPSLRDGLRARFPRRERRKRGRALAWVLAVAALTGTLAIGMEQAGDSPWDFHLAQALDRFFNGLKQEYAIRRVSAIVSQIRRSDPKVYIDGQPAEAVEFGPATRMDVRVPGDGVYSIILLNGLSGWTRAGRVHGNTIEFRAGDRQVRIECSQTILNGDRPVFVRRRP